MGLPRKQFAPRHADATKASGERPVYLARYYSKIPGAGVFQVPPQAQLDYNRLAGNLHDNGVVAVCLAWLRRQVPQGELVVGRADAATREREPIEGDHPIRALQRRINPGWSWASTVGAISDCLSVDGNAYLFKARDGGGRGQARELYWIPNEYVYVDPNPDPNPARPVRAYWFRSGTAAWEQWEPEDVVHLRTGIDALLPWMGISALKRQIRSIVGLNAGETYTAAILRHGHAGKLLSPRSEATLATGYGEESGDEVALRRERDRIVYQATGENSGRIAVTTLPLETLDLGDGPEQMLLDRILDRPEAMVVAALGLNSLVLGLPSSHDTRTYSNYAEARRDAWESGVVPLQDTIADELARQLLYYTDERGQVRSEWGDPDGLELWWDRRHVAAMREDATERANRAVTLFQGTLLPRNRALAEGGFDPVEDEGQGEAYYGDPSPMAQEQAEEIAARGGGPAWERDHPEPGDEEAGDGDEPPSAPAKADDAPTGKHPKGRWITVRTRAGKMIHVLVPARKPGKKRPRPYDGDHPAPRELGEHLEQRPRRAFLHAATTAGGRSYEVTAEKNPYHRWEHGEPKYYVGARLAGADHHDDVVAVNRRENVRRAFDSLVKRYSDRPKKAGKALGEDEAGPAQSVKARMRARRAPHAPAAPHAPGGHGAEPPAAAGRGRKREGAATRRAAREKPPVDGDHDGRVYDGTGREMPAPRQGGPSGGASATGRYATRAEWDESRAMAQRKIAAAPVPGPEKVAKMRAALDRAKTDPKARAGGDARGSSADRKARARKLFAEFGGDARGYVVCHETGIKMHWSPDPAINPHGYPTFEQGKIFTARQGGGYTMPNLLPESFKANRSRNDRPVRPENLD